MSGTFARVTTPEAKGADSSSNAPSLLLQRCGCGAAAATGGECSPCQEKRMGMQRQRGRRGDDARTGAEAPRPVTRALASPGRPLDERTRAVMESHTGRDFRGVRIHTDDPAAFSARAVGALAYAVGRHVVFAPGRYDPHSAGGRRLLAHELTHVAQQDGLRRPAPGSVRIAGSGSGLEEQAENAGRRADPCGGGRPPSAAGDPAALGVQRQRGPDVRLDLRVHHGGRLSLTLADPDTPPLRADAVSLRATPAGPFELTTPRGISRLDAGEVPRVLSDVIRQGGTPGTFVPVRLHVPTCSGFHTLSGSRPLSFGESQGPGREGAGQLPLTPPFFDVFSEGCRESANRPDHAPEPAGEHLSGPVMAPRGGGLMGP